MIIHAVALWTGGNKNDVPEPFRRLMNDVINPDEPIEVTADQIIDLYSNFDVMLAHTTPTWTTINKIKTVNPSKTILFLDEKGGRFRAR